jgi:hypothetical protein
MRCTCTFRCVDDNDDDDDDDDNDEEPNVEVTATEIDNKDG